MHNSDKLQDLIDKVEKLIQEHNRLGNEIKSTSIEIKNLAQSQNKTPIIETKKPVIVEKKQLQPEKIQPKNELPQTTEKQKVKLKSTSTLESFIGENLFSKIGIIILILGIGLGVKYAIDQNLVNQVMRVVLGYVAGFGLLGLAFWLFNKYRNYSAVLASGGLATLYYTTFVAFNYYQIFPQLGAFGIMLAITLAAVYVATVYDLEIIAVIGQVGAYAIPLLLSDKTGDERILFSYVLIINLGIMFLSFKKNWKRLLIFAFIISWAIFIYWFIGSYKSYAINSTFIFATLFFLVFYISEILSQIKNKSQSNSSLDITLKINALVYLIIGLLILHKSVYNVQSWFPMILTLFFILSGFLIEQIQPKLQSLKNQVIGLSIIFATISVFYLLKYEWIVLGLIVETFILIFFGLKWKVEILKNYAVRTLLLTVFTLIILWIIFYIFELEVWFHYKSPANLIFFISLLMICLLAYFTAFRKEIKFTFINVLDRNQKGLEILLPLLLLIIGYLTFYLEIFRYWQLRIDNDFIINSDEIFPNSVYQLYDLQDISLINYSFLFLIILGIFSWFRGKSYTLFQLFFSLSFLALGHFLLKGFNINS